MHLSESLGTLASVRIGLRYAAIPRVRTHNYQQCRIATAHQGIEEGATAQHFSLLMG
jgi:hypothetical protein